MHWEVTEGISEEVTLNLKLSGDRKEPPTQRVWGEAEETMRTKT